MAGLTFSSRRLEAVAVLAAAAVAGAAIVQLAYATGPLVPIALAAAPVLTVLTVARPVVSLYAAIALVPLELVSFSLGPAALSPAEAFLALTGVGWAASRLIRGEAPFVPSPLGKPLALLVLAVVPGLAIAPEPVAVAKVFLIWGCFLLVYQMIVAEADARVVRNLLFVLAMSGAVVGAIAIVKSGGVAPELSELGETATGRARSSFGHPNTLATFEALALPGALALAITGPLALRPLAIVAFAVIFAGLALSLSRGGLLAVAGGLAMMLVWAPFRRTVVATALVVGVLAIAGGNPFGDTQQVQLLTARLGSIGYSAGGIDPRFRLWEVTPEIIADHPVIGIGENAFPEVAPRYNLLLGNSRSTFEHAHNIPLTIAAELGLVGLAALAWFVVALGRVLVLGYRRGAAERQGMLVALAAAFVAVAVQGLVDYTLRSAVIVGVITTLAGCAVVLARKRDDEVGETG
jgi:putative inorganic carbon (HCO3(-)) transporter